MALINPYIHFNGNAEEAFTFYKSVFGGAFAKFMHYKDLSSPEHPVAENDANRLMHIALPIGKSNVLMGKPGRCNDHKKINNTKYQSIPTSHLALFI